MRIGARVCGGLLAFFFVCSLGGVAGATVTEPNGLAVPIDSSPEVQLSTLFSQRGETINWQTDSHPTPNTFSPLCGFTATYVLNQAGSHFGLAWYNDTGAAPQPADLHQLVASNSAVGTSFSGTSIKSDPAYTGGVVGFALIGGETHYTNASYDTVYSSNNQPWVTALMYASTATPNAYYVCFEDGSTSASGWNNDGDFNDDVYFVTGVTCNGGGQPCDTGLPGICGPGVTVCNASGTTCQGSQQAAPGETCNGLDDNCNGTSDENAVCPEEEVCDHGTCVKSCASAEFPCKGGLVCSKEGHCVDPACVNVTCPDGKVCVGGTCKAPCDGVVCPHPQECRQGTCVDPCAGVTCQAGQVCTLGVCITACTCQPCAGGTACDSTSGACMEASCVGKTCGAGQYCVAGTCTDDCAGAVCPAGQLCSAGACVPDPDAGAGGNGGNGGGFGNPGGDDGGLLTDAGGTASNGAAGDDSWNPSSKSGCGCRSGVGGNEGVAALAIVGIALAWGRRRARRKN